MSRNGDWIQTFSGIEFYPMDPRPEEVKIEDIAHSLSNQCRYTGHVRQFYSVAEHSIRVAESVPPEFRLSALLHDASEAYLVDLPRPVKRHSEIGRLYREAEDMLMKVICEKFGLSWPVPEPVERADKAMLWIEARDLMPPHQCWNKWRSLTTGRERPILHPLTPKHANYWFLSVAENLISPSAGR